MADTILYRANAAEPAILWIFDAGGFVQGYKIGMTAVMGSAQPGHGADVYLPSPHAAECHGQIALIGDSYYYKDLGSAFGTIINKKRLGTVDPKGETSLQLQSGDVIKIGSFGAAADPGSVIALFTRNLPADCRFETIVLSGNTSEVRIGRSAVAGIQLSDKAVSEKHASFFRSENGWVIIDHTSTNGVYLNGKRLTTPRYLDRFDVVRIAGAYFVFLGDRLLFSAPAVTQRAARPEGESRPVAAGNEKLFIHIIERSVMRRFKKLTLLQDINISVATGDMVLILGGSGAGKTTFLNAVMGYEKAKGSIVYDNTDIYEEYDRMKYEIGFVPQNDLLRGSDNVYATLENAAKMKLPAHMTDEARRLRVDEMLNDFGLTRERDSLVSKLSGGQRKRLSIAVEFISRPKLFFLDEPDSGIDDIMGRGLMEHLRHIADSGTIVMVITHSPERAADLFDKVIVLAKSSADNRGHLAFYGTPDEAFSFFDVTSFRGIVKRVNRPDENGEGLSDYYIEKYKQLEAQSK